MKNNSYFAVYAADVLQIGIISHQGSFWQSGDRSAACSAAYPQPALQMGIKHRGKLFPDFMSI